ncbi:MAG TPA: CapA family protein [Mycobacteriales bacterium]|nr:CapA family protein [Mycobacteriales bacterium]
MALGRLAVASSLLVAAGVALACTSEPAVGARGRPVTSAQRPSADRSAKGRSIEIAAVGDTELGNTPTLPSHPKRYLAAVDRTLRGHADIVFGNLEGTLTSASGSKCGAGNGGNCFAFRTPPRYARYLAQDGFTVLNNANNHSHDFGSVGLRQTIRAIHRAGMKQTGLPGEITVIHVHGVAVAFVAFAPYSNTADLLNLKSAAHLIRRARNAAGVVVVYMHAGAEGADRDHVTGHEEYYVGEDRGNPERFAHLAIRNGASLVIASGPHVVRGMQFYRHRLIAYSLGNFANFHNFASGGILSDSAILHVTLSRDGAFRSGRLFSVVLDGSGHPALGGGTVGLVRRLSREDFGSSRARLGTAGVIRPQ